MRYRRRINSYASVSIALRTSTLRQGVVPFHPGYEVTDPTSGQSYTEVPIRDLPVRNPIVVTHTRTIELPELVGSR